MTTVRPDEIRDDFVEGLNSIYMEKVGDRTDQMVGRDGTTLKIQNLSTFFVTDAEEFIGEWREGIERAKRFDHPEEADLCLFGAVGSLFDKVEIHSVQWPDYTPGEGELKIFEIDTERERVLGAPGI